MIIPDPQPPADLPWKAADRATCPKCGSDGRRRMVPRGAGPQWVYLCGATWNDYAAHPQTIAARVACREIARLRRLLDLPVPAAAEEATDG